jgi:hypothetical protein
MSQVEIWKKQNSSIDISNQRELRGNPQNARQFGASLKPLGASLKPLGASLKPLGASLKPLGTSLKPLEWRGLGLQLRQGRTLLLLPRGPVPVVGS